tara:strand:- start:9487 stop:11145 length:1659 start_codon:yes stop_codon:yes gene_type:complete
VNVLLRIEGVNFQNTLFDTDDLSTNRGASLAYLNAPDILVAALQKACPDLEVEIVYTGASGGVFNVQGCDAAMLDQVVLDLIDGLQTGQDKDVPPIYRHLGFASAAVAVDAGYLEAESLAQAIIRKRQLQSVTIDVPDPRLDNAGRCRIDQFRPADGGKIITGSGQRFVSQSVQERRSFGRDMRQNFYPHELAGVLSGQDDDIIPEHFANSFQDIVANPPKGLPESLQAKMAVLYLDGNSFGKARRNILSLDTPVSYQQGMARAKAFSDHVQARRRALLCAILTRFNAIAQRDADGMDAVYYADKDTNLEPRFRFETLLWGGDEMMFVFPSWLLETVLDCVAENLCDPIWKLPATGEMLTHGGGVVVCNAKTPIREIQGLVRTIADQGKDHAKKTPKSFSGFTYLILESEAPPPEINTWRKTFYGTGDIGAFTIDFAEGYRSLADTVGAIKADGIISRGQVYNLLRRARAQSDCLGHSTDHDIALVEDWMENTAVFGDPQKNILEQLRSDPAFGGSVHPLLPFKRLAELWDYLGDVKYSEATSDDAREVVNG